MPKLAAKVIDSAVVGSKAIHQKVRLTERTKKTKMKLKRARAADKTKRGNLATTEKQRRF